MKGIAMKPTAIAQETITYAGLILPAVRLADGRRFVPVRWICGQIGLDPRPQLRRIGRWQEWEGEILTINVETQGGLQPLVCLGLRGIVQWLMSLNAQRMSRRSRELALPLQKAIIAACDTVPEDEMLGALSKLMEDANQAKQSEVAPAARRRTSHVTPVTPYPRLIASQDLPDNLPQDIYAIYALIDPRTGGIRYVGLTVAPRRRLLEHLRSRHAHSAKLAWLEELDNEGLVPIMRILETGINLEREALDAERKWITHFLGLGAALTNAEAQSSK